MYLGLDLGTSGLKGILITKDQEVLGAAEHNYSVQNLATGWSEQNPSDWIDACSIVMDSLCRNFPSQMSELKGIGISGQMHGATLLDKNGAVIRPCILWNDTRSYAQAQKMDGVALFRELSGNIVFPGFTAPKVVWVKENEPENFKKIASILLPKDFLRFWLTGDLISEKSDAAGTSWLDLEKRCWSEKLLESCGLNIGQMPTLIEGSEVGGSLKRQLKNKWNMKGDILVVGGAGDNAAAACGCGVMSEGQGFISLGTSGVILAARDGCYPSPETAVHTFCHAVPNKWYQMGVILAAADSLNWLSKIVGKTPEELSSLLHEEPTGPSTLKFVPYLAGERTPHNDSVTRGAFIGLDIAHNLSDLTQAVFEGVAFALKDNLMALNKTGAKVEKLFALGGGVQSKFWLKTIANILNMPLVLPKSGELGAALGASRLALAACENMGIDQVMTQPSVQETIDPQLNFIEVYTDAYRVYGNIYPSIKELK
jgi:xylulokinase